MSSTDRTVDQQTIRDIILFLSREYQRWYENASGGPNTKNNAKKMCETYERVALNWRGVAETELENFFNATKANLTERKAFIYLKPVEKGDWIIPILSISYDFESNFPVMRLRLSMFLVDKEDELRAIGYRFETPESEGDGIHNYYHAQLIYKFDNDERIKNLPCPEWVPESQPAFALDATTPLTLLVCMIGSLYGPEYVFRNILGRPGTKLEQLAEIAFLKSPHAPSFSSPVADASVNSLTSINGVFTRNPASAPISHVHLRVQRDDTKHYWDGSGWKPTQTYLPTVLSGEKWRYDCSSLRQSSLPKGIYTLQAVIYDQKHRLNSRTIVVEVK